MCVCLSPEVVYSMFPGVWHTLLPACCVVCLEAEHTSSRALGFARSCPARGPALAPVPAATTTGIAICLYGNLSWSRERGDWRLAVGTRRQCQLTNMAHSFLPYGSAPYILGRLGSRASQRSKQGETCSWSPSSVMATARPHRNCSTAALSSPRDETRRRWDAL